MGMIAFVKFIHISAIAVWSAGLVSMPSLYVQRPNLGARPAAGSADEESLHRLHRIVRFAYVCVLSPAAFIAVASGILLIFQREVFEPWFSLKLAFVSALVLTHTLTGMTLVRLFEGDAAYSVRRCLLATSISLFIVVMVLVLVLAKPTLSADVLPIALHEPGALRSIARRFIPWFAP